MKKFSIGIILVFLFSFIIFDYNQKLSPTVLNVISPTEFEIDINNDKEITDNERFCIANIDSFSSKQNDYQTSLAKKFNLKNKEIIALGYLAESFAQETLLDQKVKIKTLKNNNQNCKSVQINIDGHDYEKKLLEEGFASKNGQLQNKEKNLKKIHKLNFKILNTKNNKYHELDCIYGQMANRPIIMPAFMLPKNAIPCKFCHLEQTKTTLKNKNKKVSPPKTIISDGYLKLYLTDLTTTLKPNSKCDTKLCQEIVSQINTTKHSIDMAFYGYGKVEKIESALLQAKNRGVNIRFVYDINSKGENLYPDTMRLAKILKLSNADFSSDGKTQNIIMHNKFFIFDNTKVITGTANLSPTDMSGFNSNAVLLIHSLEIAQIFEKEFQQMYDGKFHNKKLKSNTQNIKLGANSIKIYFSPQDNAISSAIIPLINSSKKYIYIPTFLITHKQMTSALINAKNRGIDIKMIIDATNARTKYSQHETLRKSGIKVKTENYAGKMHSKVIIIDDKYLIIGSMNFSNSGENKNDENLIIINNPKLAIFYKNFFEYLWEKIPNKWLKYNAKAEGFDSIGSCSDGIDNDFDGNIDDSDSGCLKKK